MRSHSLRSPGRPATTASVVFMVFFHLASLSLCSEDTAGGDSGHRVKGSEPPTHPGPGRGVTDQSPIVFLARNHWEFPYLCSRGVGGGGLLGGSCSYSSLFPFSISADPHDRGHHCWRPHSWHADCTHRLNEVYGTKCPFLGSQHRQHYTLVSKHTQPFPGNRRKIRRDLSNTIDLLSSELSSDSISYT